MSAANPIVAFPRRRVPALRRLAARLALHACAVAIAAVASVPTLWALSTSLKTRAQVMVLPPEWIPNPVRWQNYLDLFAVPTVPFGRFIQNSLLVTGLNVGGELVFGIIAAYGFARFRFAGRDGLFLLLLSSMVLPREVTIVPLFVIYKQLGWIDTLWPLIVPHWFGGAFVTFLLRQCFLSIPRDLDDAAKLDGAGALRILYSVLLPLAKPTIATAAIFVFIANWNNLWEPLIFLTSVENFTLALGMTWFRSSGGGVGTIQNLANAYAVLMTLPVLALFFSAQKYFVKGVVLSASKD